MIPTVATLINRRAGLRTISLSLMHAIHVFGDAIDAVDAIMEVMRSMQVMKPLGMDNTLCSLSLSRYHQLLVPQNQRRLPMARPFGCNLRYIRVSCRHRTK